MVDVLRTFSRASRALSWSVGAPSIVGPLCSSWEIEGCVYEQVEMLRDTKHTLRLRRKLLGRVRLGIVLTILNLALFKTMVRKECRRCMLIFSMSVRFCM